MQVWKHESLLKQEFLKKVYWSFDSAIPVKDKGDRLSQEDLLEALQGRQNLGKIGEWQKAS